MAATSHPPYRGSEWRKWDLHVHTPASYDWDRACKDSAGDIVKKALSENLAVIAITDHHTISGIDAVLDSAKETNLVVLPGVELRTDKGNKRIHILAVFNEELTAKTLYDKLLCPLNLSEKDIEEKGNEHIYCNFEAACKKIHELGGLVLLHAGQKANGIEQLDSDIKAALKTNLASLVDIFEVSASKQARDYRTIVFPKIKQEFPCVITSDACDRSQFNYKGGHSTEVIGKKYTWIKSDQSFEGLRQILYEPVARVSLEEHAPIYHHPQIISLKLRGQKTYAAKKDRFPPISLDQEVYFSPNLTTVIGARAAGKTVLAEMIGFVANKFSTDKGDSKQSLLEYLSDEFPDLVIELIVSQGAESPVALTRSVKDYADPYYAQPFYVEYWTQGEIERKADSPTQISEYISNRLHSDQLDESAKEITELIKEMDTIRVDYAAKLQLEIENKKLEAERGQIESYFKKLKTKEYKEITERIKENRAKRQLLESLIQDVENQTAVIKKVAGQISISATADKVEALNLFDAIDPLRRRIEAFLSLKDSRITPIVEELDGIAQDLRRSDLFRGLELENKELMREFTEYCSANGVTITKTEVEKRNNRIKFIDQRRVQLENVLKRMERDRKHHAILAAQLKLKFNAWVEENGRLIVAFNESFGSATISAVWSNPTEDVTEWIAGQFVESNNKLKSQIEKSFKIKSPVREDNVEDIINELVDNLKGDAARAKVVGVLKSGKIPTLNNSSGKTETLRWFFQDSNTEIIREDLMMRLEQYSDTGENNIKYGNKILGKDSMSFGERCGTLVELILLSGDHPLVIDQPEDHLDARFVAEKIVEVIREQKLKRQIIICTHNANIVVLGDSELVNALSADVKSNIRVLQGSLENKAMREVMYDVLEGGERAFKKREQKYGKTAHTH